MEAVNQATEILKETEIKLRALLSEAASFGDYSSVVQLASWARTVHDLISAAPAVEKMAFGAAAGGNTRAVTAARGFVRPPRHPERSYPNFLRQGEHLIRIAWSKRERREYRHKSSYLILRALAAAMLERGVGGRVFSTDEFLPLNGGANAAGIPNYQAYVGIAFLKHTGLIDQHGRQGYSIPHIAHFMDSVEAVWKKLPDR